jgi:hypothetical protein
MHGLWNTSIQTHSVDADGKRQPEFMDKNFERLGRHRLMMLEHRVHAGHHHFALASTTMPTISA